MYIKSRAYRASSQRVRIFAQAYLKAYSFYLFWCLCFGLGMQLFPGKPESIVGTRAAWGSGG